jgi:hypothetical protein
MTKAILSVGALLAVAVLLAGCGGSGSASGTTGGVAGTRHAQSSGSFRASVHGFEARLQTSVQAVQNGSMSNAIASDGPVLNDCRGTVDGQIAPHASTPAQKKALRHLRVACDELKQAGSAGTSGDVTKAKQFARAALAQARVAVNLSG